MHHILIPTNLSNQSRTLLEYAVKAFPPEENKYFILYTNSSSKSYDLLISIDDLLESNIKSGLMREKEYLEKIANQKTEVELIIEKGDLIECINNCVLKLRIDLVVLGTNENKSAKSDSILHSNSALKLVKEIQASLLLMPLNRELKIPKLFLFATLLNSIHHPNEVTELIRCIQNCNGHLDILLVGLENPFKEDLPNQLEKSINGYFKQVDFTMHATQDNNVFQAIRKFLIEKEIDTLCINYRKHNIFERFIKESVSDKLIGAIDCPILILKNAEEA